MATWNGTPIPSPSQVKIPNSIPQNFNWNSYVADPQGSFNKFKGAREVNRVNWKGYKTATTNAKNIFASSPSKKFIGDAGKRIRQLKKTADATKKIADTTKKATDLTEKIHKALFSKIPGKAGNFLDAASSVGSILGIFAAIGLVVLVKFQEFVTGRIFDNLSSIDIDLTKVNTIATNNALKLKAFDTKIQKFEKELNANAKDYYQLNKQQESFGKSIVEVKKQSNDALYETREGRKIVTGLAEAARKIGNDALYEARQNKQKLDGEIVGLRTTFDAKIQSINAQISKFNSSVSDTFQKSVNSTISKIQSDLALTRSKVDAIRPQTPIDTASINANAVAAARAIVNPLQSQIGQLAGTVASLQGQSAQIPILANSIGNLAQSVSNANAKADAAMNEARNKGVPNLAPIQQQLTTSFN